jgi:hypothetical protein
MTVFLTGCRSFTAVQILLFGIFSRTTVRTLGSIDQQIIDPLTGRAKLFNRFELRLAK